MTTSLSLKSSIFATALGGVAVVALGASTLEFSAQSAKGDRLVAPAAKVSCTQECAGERVEMAFRTVAIQDSEGTTTLMRVREALD